MAVTEVFNINKEKVGEVDLEDTLFKCEVNPHLLHDVVRMQRAARRAGTACTKTRKDVASSGKKPWKQKGTGRARSGSRKSPVWRGGGTVFGPRPRSYAFSMPRKARKLALRMALSSRLGDDLLLVLDDFVMDEAKTRKFVEVMGRFDISNALIVIPEGKESLERSSRNVPGFKVMPTAGLNVYDILLHKHIILLQPCLEQLQERLG